VNERMAREVAGDESPIGKQLRTAAGPGGSQSIDLEIVGVVANTKYRNLTEPFAPIVYRPLAQLARPDAGLQLLVRASSADGALVGSIRHAALEVVPGTLLRFDGFARVIEDSILRERLMATLSAFFGLLAVLLATVGLYGVVAYSVARRTHEIGIRLALGANGGKIARMILRETLALVAIGVGAGVVLALAAARLTTALLFGLRPHDPLTLAAAVGLLGAVALLASLLPARRAARVDPMVALREE